MPRRVCSASSLFLFLGGPWLREKPLSTDSSRPAQVTVAKENADGLRLTRIVRWVADSNRLEWSDKVSGPWQRASTDGARATLRREQLTIFIVYPEERTVVCHCITHEQICWAKMLVEHLEAQKRAAQIAAAAAAEEAALAGLAAAGGAATLGRSSR